MVSIVSRMRTMRAKLFSVRCGPGAMVIPPSVKGLVLNLDGTSSGLSKFYRKMLPRIRYHNEELPIEIRKGGAFLMVRYGGVKPNLKIHARNVHHSGTLLKKLVEATKAKEIPMTEADKALGKEAGLVFHRINSTMGRKWKERIARNDGFEKKYGYHKKDSLKVKLQKEQEEQAQNTLLGIKPSSSSSKSASSLRK